MPPPDTKLRALFLSRATLLTSPGGDTIQLLKTAENLRALGVEVDVRLAGEPGSLDGYDLVHVFNVIRPADVLGIVRKARVPVFLSSIYVDYAEYETENSKSAIVRMLGRDQRDFLKVLARRVLNGERINDPRYLLQGQNASIRELCERSAMILPNSRSEYDRLSRDYRIDRPFHVVPNAIDGVLFDPSVVVPDPEFQDDVLCVARIEGRKNQLNLIRALSGAPYRVSIIGKCSPNHRSYLAQCQREAGPNIRFVEHVDHERLPAIYAAAKVHALASWFETTGLCSLEAAAMRCGIVVTDKGDQREYFAGFAHFCSPTDLDSIRKAVDKAWTSLPDPSVETLIRTQYTWRRAAEETLAAYRTAFPDA